jgi:hypothetical protein
MPSGQVYTGKFWLSRTKKHNNVKILYISGIKQVIFIEDSSVRVTDLDTKKQQTCTLPQDSMYKILSGKLDLTKEKVEIIENSKKRLRIKLLKSTVFGGGDVTLIFSKYPQTGNIKCLEGWIIDDQILFSFDPDTMTVNDPSKLNPKVFDPD